MHPLEVEAALSRLPRAKLANLPTPLEDLPRLSATLGGPRILVKRDDLTGLATGGNKTRKAEFQLGAAVAAGCDTVVTGAGWQSNHCRQTTAGARKLGMEVHLVLRGEPDWPRQGNLLLMELLGAHIALLPLKVGHYSAMNDALYEIVERLRREGRKPFLIDNHDPKDPYVASLGAVAYVDCAREMFLQCITQGVRPTHIYVASQRGTNAGLLLGSKALGAPWTVVGVSPSKMTEDNQAEIAMVANKAASVLDLPTRVEVSEVQNFYEQYAGTGYGQMTPEGVEAIKLLAQTEGLLLDPVYTSKAMSGLIDQIRRGNLTHEHTVIFVHTGGIPALFAYAEQLIAQVRDEQGGVIP